MSSSSYQVPRCHHIKTNGTQCNSPALRNERLCYFHNKWRPEFLWLNQPKNHQNTGSIILPVLEDASSIQSAIGQVMSLVLQDVIDSKKAGLLLYALQTATSNLGRMLSERHQDMYCDPEVTARTPLRDWTFAPWELEIMEKAAAEEAAREVERARQESARLDEARLDKESQEGQLHDTARLSAPVEEAATEPAEQSSTAEDPQTKEAAQAAESKKKPESETEPGLIAEIHAVAERRSAGRVPHTTRFSLCGIGQTKRTPRKAGTLPLLLPKLKPLHEPQPCKDGIDKQEKHYE